MADLDGIFLSVEIPRTQYVVLVLLQKTILLTVSPGKTEELNNNE